MEEGFDSYFMHLLLPEVDYHSGNGKCLIPRCLFHQIYFYEFSKIGLYYDIPINLGSPGALIIRFLYNHCIPFNG